jgi:predicted nucleic acid-binding protein
MKRKSVLDSSALLKFFQKEAGHEIVRERIEKAKKDGEPVLINIINAGEVYYLIKNKFGSEPANKALMFLEELSLNLYPADRGVVIMAAEIKSDYCLPYIDSFCAATALKENGEVLTSDRDFKKVAKIIPIVWV